MWIRMTKSCLFVIHLGQCKRKLGFCDFKNISSIHFAVPLRPLKLCPSNLIHILQDHFTTAVYCHIIFVYSLGCP